MTTNTGNLNMDRNNTINWNNNYVNVHELVVTFVLEKKGGEKENETRRMLN